MNTNENTSPKSAGSSAISVDLNQVIYALSDALDVVGIDDVGHGKRVGVMAESCARTVGRCLWKPVFCAWRTSFRRWRRIAPTVRGCRPMRRWLS